MYQQSLNVAVTCLALAPQQFPCLALLIRHCFASPACPFPTLDLLLLSSRASPPGLHLVCISLPFLSPPVLCLAVQSVSFPQPSFPPLVCIDWLPHPPPAFPSHLSRSTLSFPSASKTPLPCLPLLFPCKATDCLALPLNPCLAFCSFAHPSLTWSSGSHFSRHEPALSCPEDSQR